MRNFKDGMKKQPLVLQPAGAGTCDGPCGKHSSERYFVFGKTMKLCPDCYGTMVEDTDD